MKPIFASIPKCASRTLKKLGLLGELPGRTHTKITEYPEWQGYSWHRVVRDKTDWYESWWKECRDSGSLLAEAFGMTFQNMGADLQKLRKVPDVAPRRPGVNGWVPEDFVHAYRKYLANGLGLYEYCQDVITDGVKCIEVPFEQLDDWLTSHGYTPCYENRDIDYAIS